MTIPNTRETDPKPEVSGGGGAGGFIPLLRAQIGEATCGYFAAKRGLPAGLVVRPHRVVAGGWGSEPAWEHYVRYDFGGISKPCPPDLWPTHRDDALCTGWCHAYDFQRAMRNNTPVPWVTRTAPRVEWLPWTEGRAKGKWWTVYHIGDVAQGEWEELTAYTLSHCGVVAYWPDDSAGLLDRLTAAILAGEV